MTTRAYTYEQKVEIMEVICDRIAQGETLSHILKTEGMPYKMQMFRWMQEDKELSDSYSRARKERAESLVDEIAEIRESVKTGKLDAQAGKTVINSLQWQASKENAKLYGDKVEIESKSENTFTIQLLDFTGGKQQQVIETTAKAATSPPQQLPDVI